jgi:hypothetical protein
MFFQYPTLVVKFGVAFGAIFAIVITKSSTEVKAITNHKQVF